MASAAGAPATAGAEADPTADPMTEEQMQRGGSIRRRRKKNSPTTRKLFVRIKSAETQVSCTRRLGVRPNRRMSEAKKKCKEVDNLVAEDVELVDLR